MSPLFYFFEHLGDKALYLPIAKSPGLIIGAALFLQVGDEPIPGHIRTGPSVLSQRSSDLGVALCGDAVLHGLGRDVGLADQPLDIAPAYVRIAPFGLVGAAARRGWIVRFADFMGRVDSDDPVVPSPEFGRDALKLPALIAASPCENCQLTGLRELDQSVSFTVDFGPSPIRVGLVPANAWDVYRGRVYLRPMFGEVVVAEREPARSHKQQHQIVVHYRTLLIGTTSAPLGLSLPVMIAPTRSVAARRGSS